MDKQSFVESVSFLYYQCTYVTGPAIINHVSTKSPFFSLLYHNLTTTYLDYHNKVFITTAEFNGLSSAAYRNEILHSERKVLTKI